MPRIYATARPFSPTPGLRRARRFAGPASRSTAAKLRRREAAGQDLPVVNLADALELLLLIRDLQPERYDRAAARWLARYCVEVPGVDLAEAALTTGALTALAAPEQRVGALALVALAHQRRLRDVERVLRRSLSLGSDDAS
jgi:threonine aldolase